MANVNVLCSCKSWCDSSAHVIQAHGKIKEAEPEASFGEVSKRISSEWKKMDDESKAVYVAMSDDDKARYAIEKEAYVPTIGFGSDGKAIVVGKAFKAKRAKKDKNLPKGVLSAYIIFCTQMRSVIKTENPGKLSIFIA